MVGVTIGTVFIPGPEELIFKALSLRGLFLKGGRLVDRAGNAIPENRLPRLVKEIEKDVGNAGKIPTSGLVARIQAKINLYPKVIDPRTGRHIQFPSGIKGPVDKNLRVAWDSKKDRAAFIEEWYKGNYPTPRGGWDKYDIHHIQPREFGGTNEFWNLVPVERKTHKDLFNEFWREFTEL